MSSTSSTIVAGQPSSTDIGTPSATPSQPIPPGSGNPITTTGSSLYLYTFLTTLLLLLGVSCAIIIRSLILRRRFRQRVQEAIANGVFVPGLMDRPGRDIGEKPKFYDVWIGEPAGGLTLSEKTIEEEHKSWDSVVPVAVTKIPSAKSPTPPKRPSPAPTPPPQQTNALASIFRRSPPPASTAGNSFLESQTHNQSKPPSTPPSPKPTEDSSVQLSLLIAMPSAARPASTYLSGSGYGSHFMGSSGSRISHSSSSEESSASGGDRKGKLRATASESGISVWSDLEEGEIPHVELGVLEVGYKGGDKKEA